MGSFLLASVTGCRRKADVVSEAASAVPLVTDKSEGLLLSWIDDKGEFHTEQYAADVPSTNRDMVSVRVLEPSNESLGEGRFFLADLRTPGVGGAYPVRVATRSEFEDLAVARRAKNGTAVLAPRAAGASTGGGPDASAAGDPSNPGDVASRPPVILYGASWCGACHQAAAYLKKKGIRFVEHDIEQDSSAAREMQAKLTKVGKSSGSIPVLDVRGRILIGFDARSIEDALGVGR